MLPCTVRSDADIFIGAAAVSDYRPESAAPEKLKKNSGARPGHHARAEPRHHCFGGKTVTTARPHDRVRGGDQ